MDGGCACSFGRSGESCDVILLLSEVLAALEKAVMWWTSSDCTDGGRMDGGGECRSGCSGESCDAVGESCDVVSFALVVWDGTQNRWPVRFASVLQTA